MSGSILSPAQKADYLRDGHVTVRKLFDAEEIALLRQAIETDPALQSSLYDRKDTAGKATRMATWNHPGDSVYGLAARSHRVVDTMEDLLGGEVYHYHSKLTAKEPRVGGAWEWHQDYGYWYHNGCVFPYMASVMVALDASTRENGCLQVVTGSHHCGRIEHGVLPGEQVGADPRRVEEILKRMPVTYAEMEPGDGLFFHSNVLHRSDQNRSASRRLDRAHVLQRRAQRPVSRPPPSALHAAREGRRRCDQACGTEARRLGRRVPEDLLDAARVAQAARLTAPPAATARS